MVILIDSREQAPYRFDGEASEVGTLPSGDYSIRGMEELVAIERKELSDFLACCGRERDRFKRELVRLRGYRCKAVVIEATLAQILDGTPPANTPPVRIVRPPGSTWSYSNGGYLVLQQMLQDVTGQDFPTLMDDLVLTPLGMEHSTFLQPLPADLEALAAVGHHEDGEPLPDRWHIQPELAAAGLWTTPSDLASFALGVHASANRSPEALLSARSASDLTTQRFINFSLGLLVRRSGKHAWFTHNGGNEGYRGLVYCYLTAGEGAVVMANGDAGLALASEIMNSIALEYDWPDFIPEEFW